jgi:hypothetical protein
MVERRSDTKRKPLRQNLIYTPVIVLTGTISLILLERKIVSLKIKSRPD